MTKTSVVEAVETSCSHRAVIPADGLRVLMGLPCDARLYVTVPGGGDWSGCDMVLGDDVNLEVTWTTTKQETSIGEGSK